MFKSCIKLADKKYGVEVTLNGMHDVPKKLAVRSNLFGGRAHGRRSRILLSSLAFPFKDKNSPTVTHACRKRRLKWVPSAWGHSWATLFSGGHKYGGLVLQVGGWALD
jgi:hypothetical protein